MQTSGRHFLTDDGQPFHWVGVSDFALFKRWLMPDGPNALVTPRLNEWRAIADAGGYDGPITLRVFRYAAPWNKFGITDPWSYDFREITWFTQFVGDRGFYVQWTCGDSQVVLPDPDGPRGQQQHLNETCAALVACGNAFVQTCNEPFKNGIDVTRVIPPDWGLYLRETGAYGDVYAWPDPVLDYVTFHPRRDYGDTRLAWPYWLYDMPVSAAYLGLLGKPAVLNEPKRCNEAEGNVFGNRPEDFERMGSLVGWTSGVTFHSENGRDGDGLRPHERACAEASFAGAASALGS